ncbi:uncharacterized membrane protein (DUF4010 family) [Caulobacter ginsengisoli]|uniref:Uncharacterized membrane protein (DUF4010 family) n=1 Tax=Caulobacter ginsengisoli TaxID=400775 RepID=A0ABU0IY91_9CAUL|nr:DUF4010 domain-containing protein [Caulobacter ginsengisoli]MDQ0466976.1 uncharacterized membrane protein (DUF4010 family) [Caulobacter ginsengisoli]
MPLELLQRLGLALAIGFLVGVERGWQARDIAEGGRTAGIRTYALSGLLGGLAGLLSGPFGGWAFFGLALPFAAAVIVFKLREQEKDGDYSMTAIVAALLVFALGAYAAVGDGQVAAAAAVVATALLAFKPALHQWLKTLTWPELRGALVLLAMTLVALPLLPDRAYGPHGAVNPHELWLLTIALAGVSFLAYAAIRVLGPSRGAILASLAGALVSSTAATLSVARLQRQRPNTAIHLAAALLAGAVMAGRLEAIALALSPPLAMRLAWPLGAFAAVSVLLGLVAVWRGRGQAPTETHAGVGSPFDLVSVLKFALVLGVVMAAARVLTGLYGAAGLLPVAALAGLADVDAVALASGRMAAQGLALGLAGLAVLVAVAADSLSKSVIAAVVGGWRFGLLFTGGTALALAAGGAALAVTG